MAAVSVDWLQAQALDLLSQTVKVHASFLAGGGTATYAGWRRLEASVHRVSAMLATFALQ